MDKHYDSKAADRRREDRPNHIQIGEVCGNKGWENGVEVTKYADPDCWRITWCDREDGEPQEMIFHMQGIVESKSLPPMRKLSEKNKKKARHTRQWIVISGLGSQKFNSNCDGIMDVYALFARLVDGQGCIELKNDKNRMAVELGSRMFTPKEEAPGVEWVEVHKDMDTNGFMEWVRSSDLELVYGEDNVVKYGEEYTNRDGKKRTEDIKPQKIHVGDLVDKWIKARALDQLNQKAGSARLQLKKRTLSDDDEVEGTRKRFVLMSADDSG
ncbi:hypothetical protein C8J55DRAFT_484142 [Lentinula edodes]|uniref:Uncharacterized protein n=1 Tax=Lentinula lateritia TaxID=40482 RepID=A0A9W9B233_9AGAR|nr:hypothetical protein C8J55DRAFT_484142 [Lentinula edodes]